MDRSEIIKLGAKLELSRRHLYDFCQMMFPDFYKEERQYLHNLCKAVENYVENSPKRFLVINAPPRHGKLISDDTPILTSKGWKTHGELKTGDYVIAPNGSFVKVTEVHPKYYADKLVTFSDGTQIKCHENHEWVVYDINKKRQVILETRQMEGLEVGKRKEKRYRFQLPIKQPLVGSKQDLAIDPYILGAWLGDGTSSKPRFTICDKDTSLIKELQSKLGKYKVYNQQGCKGYDFYGEFYRQLKTAKVLNNKHIPDQYFIASKQQRLELLAGIIDTDGYARKKENRYIISTSNERLRDDLIAFISTFGWRVCITSAVPRVHNNIKTERPNYQIGFNPTEKIPTRLPRKVIEVFSKQRRVSIVKIESCKQEAGNCITVEGGVYCVGRRLTPTHNSLTAQVFTAWLLGKNPAYRIMTASYNERLASIFSRNVRNMIQTEKVGERVVYSDIFRNTKVKYGEAAAQMWSVEGQGQVSYLATSPNGTATGFGCDFLICDDLIKSAEEAYNENSLDDTWEWFVNTMLSRLEGKRKCIIIMTRWSERDLAGRVLEAFHDDCELITYKVQDDNGKMLCDDILDAKSCELIKREMNIDIFEANYNQKPIDVKGRLYQGFKEWDTLPNGQTLNFTDTADTGSDFLCSINGIVFEKEFYITNLVFTDEPMELTELAVAKLLFGDNVSVAKIESNNGGRGFARNVERIIKEQYGSNKTIIESVPQTKNKESRILASSAWVQNHVYMPPNWKVRFPEFYKQVMNYQKKGKNAHDDAPDVLASIYENIDNDRRPTWFSDDSTSRQDRAISF